MSSAFERLISLKILLEDMEQDLGLTSLSSAEKSVYLAAQSLKSDGGIVETKQIMTHLFTQDISRPTFFRALSKIEAKGLIRNSGLKVMGSFEVVDV